MKKHIYFTCFAGLCAFSFWLMWHTFSYDSTRGQILIGAKAWSDFGWMLPLARSFSFGNNFPPQNPFYPPAPLNYHFLFYLLVGVMEKIGLRIDWAFNLLSAGGFFLLLVMIYVFSRKLFADVRVGVLALLFFLFNGSLSFIEYFNEQGWSWASLFAIPQVTQYPSFGPWDGSNIAAIWNLNIYTNQRPLGLSLGLFLIIVYFLQSQTRYRAIVIGVIMGMLAFLNQGLLPGLVIILVTYFLFAKTQRLTLLAALIIALPLILVSTYFFNTSGAKIHLGFLLPEPFTALSVFRYWFANLGLHLFLIPVSWIISPRKTKILALSLLGIFLLPNLVQFSPDIFNNHKLFNIFIVFQNMFSAYTLVRLWPTRAGRLLVPSLIMLLIFSGIIDFFALKNDHQIALSDIRSNSDARYFYERTPPDAVVLNSTWFYHPASLSGRKIFNGYPYFTWAHGYDQTVREKLTSAIYSAPTTSAACAMLINNHIDYVELNPRPEAFINPNLYLWHDQFIPAYTNPQTNLAVYSVAQNCRES